MYACTIKWSDGCLDTFEKEDAVKVADYVYHEARKARETEQDIKEGRDPDLTYVEGYGGGPNPPVAVHIESVAIVFKEED